MRLWTKRYCLVQPAPPSVPGQRDVVLGQSGTTNESLLCDIWEPPMGTPRTGLALIYFHGGAWQALDKDFLTQPLFRRLASQGHVIVDVAYSLAPGADLNQMLRDVELAIVWVKSHSDELQVDPDRVVLMGVSGGAHLALLAAYAPDHPALQHTDPAVDMSVRAVISMFGVTDLGAFFVEYGESNPKQPEFSSQITDDLRPRIHDKTWLDKFMTRSRVFPAYRHANMPGGALLLVGLLGGTLKEIPDVYRLASPIVHVGPHCPPTLQICAEDDFFADVSHGRRLHQALCKAGATSVYVEIPEAVHGFDQYFGVSRRVAPAAQSATYDIERFLALMV
jgi:acetyl esterase/lipase